jgi:hypothetical protein
MPRLVAGSPMAISITALIQRPALFCWSSCVRPKPNSIPGASGQQRATPSGDTNRGLRRFWQFAESALGSVSGNVPPAAASGRCRRPVAVASEAHRASPRGSPPARAATPSRARAPPRLGADDKRGLAAGAGTDVVANGSPTVPVPSTGARGRRSVRDTVDGLIERAGRRDPDAQRCATATSAGAGASAGATALAARW